MAGLFTKGLPATSLFAAVALSLSALGSSAARAAVLTVLDEEFDNVGSLSGWVQRNQSAPPGNGWFQGNAGIFPAHSGAPDAYAGASYLGAAGGNGIVDSWLITPVLNLYGASVLSFYTRSAGEPGFKDVLEVRYSSGASTDSAGFTTLLATIGGAQDYPADWSRFSASLATGGSGRFAFRYLGRAESLSQIGLDSVSVVTTVPEPSPWMTMALALAASLLPLLRRRARHASRYQ